MALTIHRRASGFTPSFPTRTAHTQRKATIANQTKTPIMWTPPKVDRLEAALDAATGDSIMFSDPDTGQTVEILVNYGRHLVTYLNEQLTIPLAERQHAH